MDSRRSADGEARRESLDTAFWLRPEQLARAASDGGPLAPAAEVLHAVASALGAFPFGAAHGIEIRRISELTLAKDASLDAPVEVRTRAVDERVLSARRALVTIRCQLTNRFGSVAAFSVETEVPLCPTPRDRTAVGIATTDADLDCVDNIPV